MPYPVRRHEQDDRLPVIRRQITAKIWAIWCLDRKVAEIRRTIQSYIPIAYRPPTRYVVKGTNPIGRTLYQRIEKNSYPSLDAVVTAINELPTIIKPERDKGEYDIVINGTEIGKIHYISGPKIKKRWIFLANGGRNNEVYGFMDEVPFRTMEALIETVVASFYLGDPGATRTRDLYLRKIALYPAELRDQ